MDSLIPVFLNELRQTQFQPREWMLDYQRRLLEPLLRHARAYVPFYRDTGRLDPVFGAGARIEWDRWNEIPLLTRREVQQNFEALKSEYLPADHGNTWTLMTSGSTGEPVSVVHSAMSGRVAWAAQLLRDFERYRIDPKGSLAFLRPPKASGPEPETPIRKEGWFPSLASLGLLGSRFDLSDTLPASVLVDAVVDIGPNCMRVQPVALDLMCGHDTDGRLGKLGMDAIFTVGERFTPEAKRDVSLHLGCRIMDHYASQECGRMATSCPGCGQFHIDAEVNLVEVTDEAGIPLSDGDVGWVIVTPLYNYAMPLIRYDHADQAMVGASDACVIKLPALKAIYGKERHPFRFTDGTVIRPTLRPRTVIEFLGAQAYQFAQVAPDRCEVRFVRGSLAEEDMQFEKLTEYLRSIWWRDLQVDYRIVDSLPRPSTRGKVPLFVNEVGETSSTKIVGTPWPI